MSILKNLPVQFDYFCNWKRYDAILKALNYSLTTTCIGKCFPVWLV